jgi:hypothetical protein
MFSFEGWRLPCHLDVLRGGLGINNCNFYQHKKRFYPSVKVYILVSNPCIRIRNWIRTALKCWIRNHIKADTVRMNDVIISMLDVLSAGWIPFPSLRLIGLLNVVSSQNVKIKTISPTPCPEPVAIVQHPGKAREREHILLNSWSKKTHTIQYSFQ